MKGKTKPIIAYGAAKFSSSGTRGERSVPTTYLERRCSSFFRTVMLNEYNTSQACNECYQKLSPCKRGNREIRGLRWCGSTCRKLFNRDVNASLNIGDCLSNTLNPSIERPGILSRSYEKQKGKILLLH